VPRLGRSPKFHPGFSGWVGPILLGLLGSLHDIHKTGEKLHVSELSAALDLRIEFRVIG
jgi:hypothetical protein